MYARSGMDYRDHYPVLQRLYALQEFSLAQYAAQAQLYGYSDSTACLATIMDIAEDQSLRASSIGALLAERRVPVAQHGFPLHFTGLNYVAANHVVGLMLARQHELIAEINVCVAALTDDAEGQKLGDEILLDETDNLRLLQRVAGNVEIVVHDSALAA